jgi:hypothetical protein
VLTNRSRESTGDDIEGAAWRSTYDNGESLSAIKILRRYILRNAKGKANGKRALKKRDTHLLSPALFRIETSIRP